MFMFETLGFVSMSIVRTVKACILRNGVLSL